MTTDDAVRTRAGRPRSEEARQAVLHAVDDLLGEVGYAAMTMKGIAAAAGVGRQTVYRWWSSKAEILLEASAQDALEELAVDRTGDLGVDAEAFLSRLEAFLTRSAAGAGYLALLGEAQHDRVVRELLGRQEDVLLEACRDATGLSPSESAVLCGPIVFWVMNGQLGRGLALDDVLRMAVQAVTT